MKRLLLFSVSLLYILLAQGQPGKLDRSFAGNGWTFADMPVDNYNSESARDIITQANDKLLVVVEVNNYTVLTRYLTSGTRDNSFGNNGYSDPVALNPAAAAQQGDGKIVVAGFGRNLITNNNEPIVARFNADGTLDRSFGENGRVTIQTVGISFQISDVAIQNNNKIVVAGGYSSTAIDESNFVLARLNSNGSPDNSFDGDGVLVTDFGGIDFASALAIQSDGKIIAAGNSVAFSLFTSSFVVARYNPDGSLDYSFSEDGKELTGFGSSSSAYDVVIQSNGKIVVVGQASSHFAVARYNAEGSLDNSFSSDGRVITEIGTSSAAFSVALSNDKIVVSGTSSNPSTSSNHFAVARYNSNGLLDNGFSGDGKATIALDTSLNSFTKAYALLVNNDGKIIIAGETGFSPIFLDIALVRYNSNGTLDQSFNGDGQLIDYYQTGASIINDIAVQKDGKIVVAGSYYTNPRDEDLESTGFALARFHPDGTLDMSFGNNGIVNTRFNINDQINAIAIQEDGRIVVAGFTSWYDLGLADFALARYNQDGSLDNTFGAGGKVITSLGTEDIDDFAYELAIQADSKIVVVGRTGGDAGFALVRYNPNGSLDNTFGGNGIVTTDFGLFEEARAISIQPDGKIIAAGRSASNSENSDFAIARYNPDGSLDNSFDRDGKVIIDIQGNDEVASIGIQKNGKIVLAGSSYVTDFNANNFTVVRLNPEGILDPLFDGDGKVITDFGYNDVANDITIQEDGKITAAGHTSNDIGLLSDIAIARYNSNGSLDDSFDGDGKVITDLSTREGARALAVDSNRLYVGGFSRGPASRGLLAAYQLSGCAEQVYYRDKDKDGYGDPSHKRIGCMPPTDYVSNDKDCNDRNAAIHPGAQEICGNMQDENCDGQIDEGCPSTPWVVINNVTVHESQGKATLGVYLSKKSDQPVYVTYYTKNGSAKGAKAHNTSGRDYILTSGVLVLKPGTQHTAITVRILNDGDPEGDEYFKVQFGHVYGARTNHLDEGKVTIKDNDTPTISPDITKPSTPKQVETKEQPAVQKLTIKALPNPSSSYFILQLQSANEDAVSVTVMDATGRIIESLTGVAPNTMLPIGHTYRPGTYYVRAVQGIEITTLTLLKQVH